MYIYIYVYMYMYMYICLYRYRYISIYIYIPMHTHTHTHTHTSQQIDEVSVKLMIPDINRIVYETHRTGTLEERDLCHNKIPLHGHGIDSGTYPVNICEACFSCEEERVPCEGRVLYLVDFSLTFT